MDLNFLLALRTYKVEIKVKELYKLEDEIKSELEECKIITALMLKEEK